jgi:glycosyltransferase involved in cell wall biosynthesis
MKILMVVTSLNVGGAERQVVDLADKLVERGHKVKIVYLTGKPIILPQSFSIEIIPLNITFSLNNFIKAIKKIKKIVKDFNPGIVHSHMIHANIFMRIVRIFVSFPVLICTAHNFKEEGKKGSLKLREFLYRITDPLCDITTQVGKSGMERYIKNKVTPANKIVYMPNGIDVNKFQRDELIREKMKKEMNLDKKFFVWLAVGRLVAVKNYNYLLQAFKKVIEVRKDAILLIAGGGELENELKKLMDDLLLNDSVIFLGVRNDINKLMNVADTFVLPSDFEGLPLTIIEAQLSSLPVVATNVSGIKEVVKNGETGYLVPIKDSEALAEKMLEMMNLSELERIKMGKKGREYVASQYDLEKIVDKWISLYQKLLEKNKK